MKNILVLWVSFIYMMACAPVENVGKRFREGHKKLTVDARKKANELDEYSQKYDQAHTAILRWENREMETEAEPQLDTVVYKVFSTPMEAIDDEGAFRLNSGGNSFISLEELQWNRDAYYIDGRNIGTKKAIPDSNLDPIYQTERYGKEFGYKIPLDPGDYTVVLHMNEIYYDDKGKRSFSVEIQEKKVLTDYDPLFYSGKYLPQTLRYKAKVTEEGVLTLFFQAKSGFAKLSGLEIIPLPNQE